MSFHEGDYREIITKAVCGSGRKREISTNHVKPSHKPTSILGCWVINHKYHAKKKTTSTVEVYGKYDINIWYSYDNNTRTEVVSEQIDYCDNIELSSQDIHCLNDEDEVMAKVIQQPNCLQCKIEEEEGNQVAVEIEKEFVVNVIGETKVNVKIGMANHQHDQSFADQGKAVPFKGNN